MKKRILVCDDEESIRLLLTESLQDSYEVVEASNGRDALRLSTKEHFDLIIMDMIMPGMGGGETFDHLKKINADIKVLLSSGYSINGQASEILERGCDGFIQKPFNINQLSEKIQGIIAPK